MRVDFCPPRTPGALENVPGSAMGLVFGAHDDEGFVLQNLRCQNVVFGKRAVFGKGRQRFELKDLIVKRVMQDRHLDNTDLK